MVTPEQANARKETRHAKAMVRTVVLRCVLVFFTLIALILVGLLLICNLIFNGPSESARNVLTMSMLESSGMKWFPALFIGQEKVQEIQAQVNVSMKEDATDTSKIVIDYDAINSGADAAWKDYPDGIRIEKVSGSTYNAYVMLIRDPSKVYLATSTSGAFSMDIPGTRINEEIDKQGAIAAINAGAFFDNGTSSPAVGSVPQGLTISEGVVRWDGEPEAGKEGFAGFNKDNILIVTHSMTAEQAMEKNIRDGCCFGPALIINGETNSKAYNEESGYNPRTAIGQLADGTVVFVCIDGRQAGSLGGTYADIIDIMVEYGVVNGCNMDGGSSTVMLYRDRYGRYAGSDLQRFDNNVVMINNYSLMQSLPRKMPTFFMVRGSED